MTSLSQKQETKVNERSEVKLLKKSMQRNDKSEDSKRSK